MSAPEPQNAPVKDDYLYERAETELKLAQSAGHPNVVRVHYLLAGHYLDRYYSDSGSDGLSMP